MGLLRRKGMQPRNYSITSDKPNNVRSERNIKRLLKRQIEPSSTLVVYITQDTRNKQVGKLGDRNRGQDGQTHRRRMGARRCRVPHTLGTGQIPPCNRRMERREHRAGD